MRFSIGYQLPDELDSMAAICKDFREHIAEVYFAWPGEASGRSPVGMTADGVDRQALATMEEELRAISDMGIKLNLLFNAACYGGEALSVALAERVHSLVACLSDSYNLYAITTTSPFIARVAKEHFDAIDVRASVNMRLGTVKALEYQKDSFDSFYMQREFNRVPERIEKLKVWCDANQKSLHILANSGCLSFCSWQSFHDNLVAHEAQICRMKNHRMCYPAPCWEYLADRKNWAAILQNTWIRPEDIGVYEKWFSSAKLATRMHANPRKVLAAYVRGRFQGNLLDLMEPGYGPLLKGYIFDNTRFPKDWFSRVTGCDKDCENCSYCGDVLERVLIPMPREPGS
jgi:collagenase-like PrtC family protease